jgi:hypothetical protein
MPESNDNSFAVILNLLDVKFPLPFEIVPGHHFRKADEDEIRRVRDFLKGMPVCGDPGIPFEFNIIADGDSTEGKSLFWHPLKQEDWRYYVIAFQGVSNAMYDLRLAACLSTVELRADIQFHPNGFSLSSQSVFTFLFEAFGHGSEYRAFEERDLMEIRSAYYDIKNAEKEFPDIKHALQLFLSLDALPLNSDFRVLGMFAVIESAICHRPKSTETGDSLTHQVRTKLPLFTHRFPDAIDYSVYFGDTPEDTVWAKLYDYRSHLAHGGKPDFAGKLSVLKGRGNVATFLRVMTKALLRNSLKEPQLYMDLREV